MGSTERGGKLIIVFYFVFLLLIPFGAFCFGIYQLFSSGVPWSAWSALLLMYFVTLSGITIGFHRYLTHHSFEAHAVVKFFILAAGSMAFQGPVISWVSVHLKHHEFSDEGDDPHGPAAGFFHSHFSWILKMPLSELQEIRKKYGKRLLQDKMVVFFDRTFFFWSIVGLCIPFLIGGWDGLLWGGLIRIFLVTHVTWSVNSICHVFGKKDFQCTDNSKNNIVIGLLAFGEGWHNNHHAFPRSAYHGLKWWQFDLSGALIRLLSSFGLIWNVHKVPEKMRQHKAL
jgi:stearoyl-CoA desaturase (delta-9 desaturase)